jgi:hypothetical protein
MVQLKVDGAMTAVLGRAKERAEILDEQGTLLGYFEPVESAEDELYRKAALLFDPEEIRRRKADPSPGHTTAEVLERLRSMGNP